MKYLILSLIAFALFIFAPTTASAQYVTNVTTSAPGQISINKMVQNPTNNQFVDNLNMSDTHFLAGQNVTFRLQVTNKGGSDLNNILVTDTLPDFIDFVSGPGSFDAGSKTLTFSIDKLGPSQSKDFDLITRVKPQNQLPNNQVTCLTNLGQARADQLFSQDTAVFCIENQVLAPVQELPKTGPSKAGLILAGSFTFLIAAIFLNKLSLAR